MIITPTYKDKNIGGRLSTRRITQDVTPAQKGSVLGVFDYGIQYFSVNSPQFQVWVDDWLEHGVIKQWCQGFGETEVKPCYCGINGIDEITKYLAKDLDVRTNTEVIKVNYKKKWLVETQSEQQHQGHMLVMTSSVPQSLS